MYMSFKHGEGEGIIEDGRFFLDFTPESLRECLEVQSGVEIVNIWEREGRILDREVIWVNGLVRGCGP